MVNFRIDIVVDPTRADRGARVVERRLVKVENRADSLRKTLSRAFAGLTAAALVGNAVRTLADFERSLATVRAVTNATAEEFERLRAAAQNLGATTRFTATQAGDALLNLSRAGFSVQESLTAVRGTLLLAQAGGLDLATASDIAASTLRGFRLEATETERVVNVLALTSNSANTTVGQLGEGLKFVAPIAAGLGVSLETTNAALGVLSDAGLKASLAGTGLRRVLGGLEAPTASAQEILAQYGLTAEDVRITTNGLVPVLQRLAQRGVDTAAALELFGQRGGPAFEVLVNSIPQVQRLNDSLNNTGNVAQRTADIIDDSLEGSLRRVQSAYEAVILAFGDAGGTTTLRQSLDGVAAALRLVAQEAVPLLETIVQLGIVFAAVQVGKFVTGLGQAAAAQLALNAQVASGTVVLLGSAEAERQRAAAQVAAAEAELAATTATLNDLRAKSQHAIVVAGDQNAIFARNAVLGQQALLEQQAAAQSEVLTAAQARLTAATQAAAASATVAGRAWLFLRTTVVSSTVAFGAIGATLFGVNRLLNIQADLLKEVEDANASLQDSAKGNFLGTALRRAREEAEALNAVIEAQAQRGVGASPAQLARLDELGSKIQNITEQLRGEADANREIQQARAANSITVENSLSALDRRIALLGQERRESELTNAVQEEFNRLLENGQKISEADRAAITSRFETIKALEDQRDALEEIRGPQEDEIRRREALDGLLKSNRITLEEYNRALEKLNADSIEAQGLDPFALQVRSLESGNQVLRARLDLGETEAQLLQTQFQLREALGRDLLPAELNQLRELIASQTELNEEIRKQGESDAFAQRIEQIRQANDLQSTEIQFGREAAELQRERLAIQETLGRELLPQEVEQLGQVLERQRQLNALKQQALDTDRAAQREAQQLDRLERALDIGAQQLEAERQLNAVLERRPDLANEIGQAVDNVRLRSLEASTELGDGFSRAFIKLRQEAEDLAAVGEAVVGAFADNATNALTEFVTTGKLNFKDFASSLLNDISRIIIRLLVVQALSSAFGGGTGGGFLGSLFGGGGGGEGANILAGGGGARAEGGTVQPGRSFLVGERGPEFFVPDRTGTIVPTPQAAPQQPPVVNVVNVQDPNEVPAAISSGRATDAILNVLAQNADRVKQVLA